MAYSQQKSLLMEAFLLILAERQGFEPWVQLPAQRFSRPPHSTALASLLFINLRLAKESIFGVKRVVFMENYGVLQMVEAMKGCGR